MLNIFLFLISMHSNLKKIVSQSLLFTVNEPLERRTHCGCYLLIVYPGLDWFTWIYCVQCLTGALGSGFRVFTNKETDSKVSRWIYPKRQKHKKTFIKERRKCNQFEHGIAASDYPSPPPNPPIAPCGLVLRDFIPTARDGNVFRSVCHSVNSRG